MKKIVMTLALGGALAASAVTAKPATSEKQAEAVTEFRQALLQVVRSNVGALNAMMRKQIPYDAAQMEKNGLRLEQLSVMMEDYFNIDTSEYKVESDALDKIWQNKADFNSKIVDLTKAAQNLQAVAKAGDEAKYQAAIGGIFKTCKGCHDSYKAE